MVGEYSGSIEIIGVFKDNGKIIGYRVIVQSKTVLFITKFLNDRVESKGVIFNKGDRVTISHYDLCKTLSTEFYNGACKSIKNKDIYLVMPSGFNKLSQVYLGYKNKYGKYVYINDITKYNTGLLRKDILEYLENCYILSKKPLK